MKAATELNIDAVTIGQFQSTPPVKAATRSPSTGLPHCAISIHAAREGGDVRNAAFFKFVGISIHAAREGGDSDVYNYTGLSATFQSTPPVKAATPQRRVRHPCGAISIHAAREGGDVGSASAITGASYFNPRRP